jgi:hypothetical protein
MAALEELEGEKTRLRVVKPGMIQTKMVNLQ